MAGYIKLYRKILQHPVFNHDGIFRLWTYCLSRANWKDSETMIPGTLEPITVKRGQFVTGREKLFLALYGADYIGEKPTPRSLSRWLTVLAKFKCIRVQNVSNRCSLITVCNYGLYQGDEDDECPPDEPTEGATGVQHPVQPASTIEEEKKVKKVKKGRSKAAPVEYSEDFLRFWEVFPPIRKGSKPEAFAAWQSAIERKPPDEILAAAIEFSESWLGQSEFCPGPAPWLNKDRWDDDRRSWEDRKSSQSLRQQTLPGSIDGL